MSLSSIDINDNNNGFTFFDSSDDDEIEKNDSHRKWMMKFIRKMTPENLEKLDEYFNTKKNKSLSKKEFIDGIDSVFGDGKYTEEALLIFAQKSTNDKISFMDLLGFLSESIQQPLIPEIQLNTPKILAIPHTKRESIMKIVLIETEKYFCYAMISKHGKVGLYDGNINFLTTYNLIMTREDIRRKEEDRRRRNRWITDSIFCPDTQLLIFTNSTRSIAVYDASGLKHVPLYLILCTPNIVESFAYKPIEANQADLFMGDSRGTLFSFHFRQAKVGLLRKKHNDKINLFYWDELALEKDYVIVRKYERLHRNEGIVRLKYCADNEALISCSRSPNCSIVKRNINKAYVFKMAKGANCFALSRKLKLLVTGSQDGVLRLWNSIITAKPIGALKGHSSAIMDVVIFEKQEVFLSCSSDATVKLWDIKEQKCIQSITVNFPAFSIFGKMIEWGNQCIYPGPKRLKQKQSKWERSCVIIACCNHIALVELKYKDEEMEVAASQHVLPPPPLQNSVLVPKTWRISDQITTNFTNIEIDKEKTKINDETLEKRFGELKFILEKDLFDDDDLHNDINYKIAKLEQKKREMCIHVARGAPYLALDLYEVSEIKLTENLPVPNRKKIKTLAAKVEEVLTDANARNIIFSEISSSRSPRSSRSSIVEFEY